MAQILAQKQKKMLKKKIREIQQTWVHAHDKFQDGWEKTIHW
jgi:hypothetical protein